MCVQSGIDNYYECTYTYIGLTEAVQGSTTCLAHGVLGLQRQREQDMLSARYRDQKERLPLAPVFIPPSPC